LQGVKKIGSSQPWRQRLDTGSDQLTIFVSDNTTDGFVYAVSSKQPPTLENNSGDWLPLTLKTLPSLSVTERSLLFHFMHKASHITCCHAKVQKELCELVIPMAVEVPSLMYATLAWAAIHKVALSRKLDEVSDRSRLVASLKTKSIEYLRTELQEPNEGMLDALLATVRTLCQLEIHSGSDGNSVWRLHIKGAKALMTSIKRSNRSTCSRSRLLCRWYASLESLAALTPSTYPSEAGQNDALSKKIPESVYLDDYNGYSTDLSLILGEIGAAAERGQTNTPLTKACLEEQADELEQAVHRIMQRDNNHVLVFYPGVAEKLSQQDILEYSLCNQAYQHTALIHIQRRLRGLPSNTPAIQHSVKRIIEFVGGIAPAYGLSPAIVLTTPLFTAGCEALGEDRNMIRGLLARLYDMLRIRNIKLALEVLEEHWADDKDNGDRESLLRKSS
jgi:hypothetical protein